MDISPAHQAAVAQAIRNPALTARLALLVQPDNEAEERAHIVLYPAPKPQPGEPAAGPAIVAINLTASVGTVNTETHKLIVDTPVEGQVTGADAENGTIPTWARIYTPAGSWWADLTVSATGGGGEIEMTPTGQEGEPAQDVVRLFNGAFARLNSIVVEG